MNHLVSIIIPVFKAERFLDGCVQSVLDQTYEKLEILLVDDGSPDGCPAMCDEYARRDHRIRVIHKANGGVSSARNAGLDVAAGRYVCFVDSDDCLSPTSVEVLAEAIVESGGQYAAGICGYMNSDRVKQQISERKQIRAQQEPEEFLAYLCTHGSYSPYAKIFDLSIIRRNQIRFNETHKCSEDSLFIRQYMKYCRTICLTPYVVYHYNTENENSLSKGRYEDYCRYFADKLRALRELTEELPMDQVRKEHFLSRRAIHGLHISLRHYFANWSDQQSRMAFVEETINVLASWVTIADPEIPDKHLSRWWKRAQRGILCRDTARVYRNQCWENRMFRCRCFAGMIKKRFRKFGGCYVSRRAYKEKR